MDILPAAAVRMFVFATSFPLYIEKMHRSYRMLFFCLCLSSRVIMPLGISAQSPPLDPRTPVVRSGSVDSRAGDFGFFLVDPDTTFHETYSLRHPSG